jgi:hypothetical protein
VRHGRSAHVHQGWIDAAGFRAWRAAYEAAGLHDDERAPAHLEPLVSAAALVVASDAPRAVASARLLAPRHEVVVSPLLRELELQGPPLGRLRLPLLAWAFAVGGRALVLRLARRHPTAVEVARVGEAAAWLSRLAAGHPLVVAVTHAWIRRRLADRLLRDGWRAGPGRRSLRHWSAWLLEPGLATQGGSPGNDVRP